MIRRGGGLGTAGGFGNNNDAEGGVPAVGGVSIYYYAGLVNKSEINQMKKLLFRASKGKVLCKVCDD
jgi:hypothetical protein